MKSCTEYTMLTTNTSYNLTQSLPEFQSRANNFSVENDDALFASIPCFDV
jgi:hypothetical protein